MKYTYYIFLVGIVLLFVCYTPDVKAESSLTSKEEVITFLGKAFNAQVSLNKQARTLEEMEQSLSPFFNREYILAFLEDNLEGTNGEYRTYRSIYSTNYIPYFQYSNSTKVEIGEDKILVYDFHDSIHYDGVEYKGSYEGLLLSNINGHWLVTNELNDREVKAMKKTREKRLNRLIYMPYDIWFGQKTSGKNYASKMKKPNIDKTKYANSASSQSISVYAF